MIKYRKLPIFYLSRYRLHANQLRRFHVKLDDLRVDVYGFGDPNIEKTISKVRAKCRYDTDTGISISAIYQR